MVIESLFVSTESVSRRVDVQRAGRHRDTTMTRGHEMLDGEAGTRFVVENHGVSIETLHATVDLHDRSSRANEAGEELDVLLSRRDNQAVDPVLREGL